MGHLLIHVSANQPHKLLQPNTPYYNIKCRISDPISQFDPIQVYGFFYHYPKPLISIHSPTCFPDFCVYKFENPSTSIQAHLLMGHIYYVTFRVLLRLKSS